MKINYPGAAVSRVWPKCLCRFPDCSRESGLAALGSRTRLSASGSRRRGSARRGRRRYRNRPDEPPRLPLQGLHIPCAPWPDGHVSLGESACLEGPLPAQSLGPCTAAQLPAKLPMGRSAKQEAPGPRHHADRAGAGRWRGCRGRQRELTQPGVPSPGSRAPWQRLPTVAWTRVHLSPGALTAPWTVRHRLSPCETGLPSCLCGLQCCRGLSEWTLLEQTLAGEGGWLPGLWSPRGRLGRVTLHLRDESSRKKMQQGRVPGGLSR